MKNLFRIIIHFKTPFSHSLFICKLRLPFLFTLSK
nr:MAG TPA: hypothetical protein [Caudoviricetes sp.]